MHLTNPMQCLGFPRMCSVVGFPALVQPVEGMQRLQ